MQEYNTVQFMTSGTTNANCDKCDDYVFLYTFVINITTFSFVCIAETLHVKMNYFITSDQILDR